MTTTHPNELIARWDERQGIYIVREMEIWSEDGDEWHDDHGGHPHGDDFEAATFIFDGGPRHGERVS